MAMFFKPFRDFAQGIWRFEPNEASTAVEGESVGMKDLQYLPRLVVGSGRSLEIKAHIHHGQGTIGTDDFARNVMQSLFLSPRILVAIFPLPVLKRLSAGKAREMVSVIVVRVST